MISRRDFYPYGEQISGVGGRSQIPSYNLNHSLKQKFTGYERDDETGLDFAQARYYKTVMGRFTSPDPFGGSGFTVEPQTWNRYTYVLNNPLRFTDPDGLFAEEPNKKKKKDPTIEIVDPIPVIVIVKAKPEMLSPFAQGVIRELARSASASNKLIGGFAVFTGLGGLGTGYAAAATGTAFGNSITTLGTLARVAPPVITAGGSVLDKLGKTDAQIFSIAFEKGLSATNTFFNNINALTEAVRTKVSDGQLNFLGNIGNSPIYGSLRSGVGIAEVEGQTVVVKVVQGTPQVLGSLPK